MDSRKGNQEIPLAERMRPLSLEEVVGQDHVLGPGCMLSKAIRMGNPFSFILWGPPGSGKTTLSRLVASYSNLPFRSFSAVTSGVKDLRAAIEEAKSFWSDSGRPTLLFVDEIHRFNKAQQDAFLPHVESGLIILLGATTQNPSFEIISPLISRVRVIVLKALKREDIKNVLVRALEDRDRGLGQYDISISREALDCLADFSQGDARVALNNLEMTVLYSIGDQGGSEIRLEREAVEKALSKKALHYDKDGEEHYNLISAFHKSLRGSDPQASVYWLYRMLEAGEDPLFIGRRMIRFASEDIGMADPNALGIALGAFEAWQKVGPPEAELALLQAAVYLATAPKSNALYLAEKAVKEEIRKTGHRPVPMHIRNAPTSLMRKLGYSRGYLYPHNYEGGWVRQEYLPEGVKRRNFYTPTGRGFERDVKRIIAALKKKKGLS